MPLIPDPGQGETQQSGETNPIGTVPGGAFLANNAEGVAETQAETRKLLDAANAGGFRISPEGVEPLRRALANMQGRLDRLMVLGSYLFGEKPRLGSHEYGQRVAEHDRKSGSGGPNSAAEVLGRLRVTLESMDEALNRAMKNYEEHEANTAESFSKLNDRETQ